MATLESNPSVVVPSPPLAQARWNHPAAETVCILPAGLVERVLEVLGPAMRAGSAGRDVTDFDVLAATCLVHLSTDARRPHAKRASTAIVSFALVVPVYLLLLPLLWLAAAVVGSALGLRDVFRAPASR